MAKWFSCIYVSMCSSSLSFSIFPYSFPLWFFTEHCCCSGPKLCPALCDSVNHSTQASLSITSSWSLLKLMSIDLVLPPNHLILSPTSALAFSLSQHQGLFQWVTSSHQAPKVLELQLQHQYFQWVFRVDFLKDLLVWSPCYPRDSQEFYPAAQYKTTNFSVLSLLYGPTFTSVHDYWKNHSFN